MQMEVIVKIIQNKSLIEGVFYLLLINKMTTSLARQLQGLKAVQKDVVKIFRKAKVSFLFDYKEAYKIEDEVIYTLWMKGIKELTAQFPTLGNQLEIYKDDVFGSESKDFYRGVQVQSDIDILDTKLKQIITIISPYFMNAASFKILEFLIRIYEVQAYHKLHLFFSFLPFYETPQFLKLIQWMELKTDPILKFFEPFASKRVKLRIEALVRFMSRENGAYLKLFSDIVFKFLTLKQEQSLFVSKSDKASSMMANMVSLNLEDNEPEENIPHYRFWTSLVFKIISTEESSRSESYLYVLIPYIAKGLESRVRDLQTGVLSVILRFLDVSLQAKKLTFSEQYMNAFLIEICKSASISIQESGDPAYFGLWVKTWVRILQTQQTTERLNERLSTLSFNSRAKYSTMDKDYKRSEDINKWIEDLLKHHDTFLMVFR